MRDRIMHDADFTPKSQLEFAESEDFKLHIHYVRAHGYPQGPLSTLKPNHRMQVAFSLRGVPLE